MAKIGLLIMFNFSFNNNNLINIAFLLFLTSSIAKQNFNDWINLNDTGIVSGWGN